MPIKQGLMATVKPATPVAATNAFFITLTGPVAATWTKRDTQYDVLVPAGVPNGQAYLVLTSSADPPTDDNIVAGPAVLSIADNDDKFYKGMTFV